VGDLRAINGRFVNERTEIATLLTNPKTLNMPEIATKLANRLKQPYSKRRIRLHDKAEKVDLLEKLRVGLMEVVRGIGTDGDPLHRAYVMAQNQTSYFAEIVSQLPEFAEYGSNAAQNE